MDEAEKKRIKERREQYKELVKKKGTQALTECQLLEYLLYFCIPGCDTQPISKKLMAKYGTSYNVFNADVRSLAVIDGITQNAALLLHTLPHIFSYCEQERLFMRTIQHTYDVVPYLRSVVPLGREEAYLVCLDATDHVICVEKASAGESDCVRLNMKYLVSVILQNKAQKVILAHNHPSEFLHPSQEDLLATHRLQSYLNAMQIEFLDHIVIGNDAVFSMVLGREIKNGELN